MTPGSAMSVMMPNRKSVTPASSTRQGSRPLMNFSSQVGGGCAGSAFLGRGVAGLRAIVQLMVNPKIVVYFWVHPTGSLLVRGYPAQTKRQPFAFGVNVKHFGSNMFADANDVARVEEVAFCQFRDVDEPLKFPF